MFATLENTWLLVYNIFMAKSNKSKRILNIVFIVVFTIMLLWYAFASFIQVNYHISYDYKEGLATKFVAHRGFSSKYFQNTYDAFYYADMSSFFGGIECDIWRTLDGKWVCSHDDTPFVDKNIKISQSNFDDIKNLPLDTKERGEFVDVSEDIFITPYEDFLGIIKYSRKKAFVEIKFEYDTEIIEELVDFTKDKCNLIKVIFISFNKKVMESIASYNISTSVMLLSNDKVKSYFYAKMGYNLGASKEILKQNRVELLHKNKSLAYVYTVNTLEEADKFEEMEVDYIATDYELK